MAAVVTCINIIFRDNVYTMPACTCEPANLAEANDHRQANAVMSFVFWSKRIFSVNINLFMCGKIFSPTQLTS